VPKGLFRNGLQQILVHANIVIWIGQHQYCA
jgi:hypothetical protein